MTKSEKDEPQALKLHEQEEEEEIEQEDMIEKWDGVVNAIRDTTKKAFPASPSPKTSSVQDFQRYWRGVLEKLAASVASDTRIPEYVSSPPCYKFEIVLFSEPNTVCCPCSHADVSPTILVENAGGVTKEDLIRGFTDYLYGDELPNINFEEGENVLTAAERRIPALVYKVNWMSAGRNEKGERKAFVNEVDRIPTVYMYCAEPDQFDKKHLEHNKKK